MASELVSLAAASQLLGVSPERVRQLVVAGDVPGVRFGNAWAVPRDAIAARRQVSNRRGRPLGERRAWQAIGPASAHTWAGRFDDARRHISLARELAAAEPSDYAAAVAPGLAAVVDLESGNQSAAAANAATTLIGVEITSAHGQAITNKTRPR